MSASGPNFTEADQLFFDQIRASAEEDEKIVEAAKANNLANFSSYLDRMLDELFIDRMEGNEEIFSRVMTDKAVPLRCSRAPCKGDFPPSSRARGGGVRTDKTTLQNRGIRMANFGLHGFVSRGARAGELLFPHKHEDGTYVVSKTRFEADYVRLTEETDILPWLEKGYGLRMSNPTNGIAAPSLIMPKSIFRPVLL